MCGVFINAVTYVTVVVAIGLLVDFIMHVLLRYVFLGHSEAHLNILLSYQLVLVINEPGTMKPLGPPEMRKLRRRLKQWAFPC